MNNLTISSKETLLLSLLQQFRDFFAVCNVMVANLLGGESFRGETTVTGGETFKGRTVNVKVAKRPVARIMALKQVKCCGCVFLQK